MILPAIRLKPQARWRLPPSPDPARIAALSEGLHLPEIVARLMCQRGFSDTERAKQYLRPRLEHLHDPLLMLDMDLAIGRLGRAIGAGELIFIHGDYDVDGICSTALLVRTIRAFGGRAEPFIPQRLRDGYDLTMAGVNAAVAAGAAVLVTCDCGTNAVQPVSAARAAGMDVIISDHHLPGGPLPECLAVLNAKRPGCPYPDKDLAAVGVAFKMALALSRSLGGSDDDIYRMLDLVALATIADVAPLRGENRVLARYGLRMISQTSNLGLRALLRATGLDGKRLTTGQIGYILAPRLNAVGRLDHAIKGVQLLLTETEHEANALAREFEELNRKRQEIDRETLVAARKRVEVLDLDETFGIVLAEAGWHPGVIGIVAARLVEDYCRPVVLVALQGDEGKGSGRSIPAFDLHGGLTECSDLLIRFGGHRAAAGVTIQAGRVSEFADRFNEVARSRLTPEDLTPEIRVDLEMPLTACDAALESLLRHCEPCGPGNPAPVLVARGVRLAGHPRVVSQTADGPPGHLKIRLCADGAELDAIGWGMGNLASELDSAVPFDVVFRLERDEWNGQNRLQAKLADLRR
ncbi:MAG: single-stranded-DNA-specific exonuclease RecJ [Gemmatimonadaceae bacterium]